MAQVRKPEIRLQDRSIGSNEPSSPGQTPAANAAINAKILKSVLLFGSTGMLIFFGVVAILPIIQVVIGHRYLKQCPVSPYIPVYQIVAGASGLTNILLVLLMGIIGIALIKPAMKAAEDKNQNFAIGSGINCVIWLVNIIQNILSIFLIIWTIVGLVWLFTSWRHVQYVNPEKANYCHPTMYRFNYWIFILPFILGPVLCCLPCFVLCGAACCALCCVKKDKGIRVPTSEP